MPARGAAQSPAVSTALRFLFGIRRFSEYLDFSLERPGHGYDIEAYLRAVRRDLTAEAYEHLANRSQSIP